MGVSMVFGEEATLEDFYEFNKAGFEFVIEDGKVTEVIC